MIKLSNRAFTNDLAMFSCTTALHMVLQDMKVFPTSYISLTLEGPFSEIIQVVYNKGNSTLISSLC